MKNLGKIIWVIALIAIIVLIGVVGYGYYRKYTFTSQNPIVTMEVENFGTIKMELYPDKAPETVSNFIALANRGFYDGTTFHRVVKDFMIQAGSKNGDGTTGAKISDLKDGGAEEDYTIKGEFLANGVTNDLKLEEGVLAMARADYTQYSSNLTEESYNSGCAQFFIMTKENSGLDGYYTAFGKVTEGLDVVHNIENVEVKVAEGEEETEGAEVSTPVNAPKVTSIRVETYGIDYGLPETLTPFDYTSWMYSQYMTTE
ncbi:MAG: peptidylprolyl isomerase [Clostridia bacterium]|nr:peptidylprolyl isomerase [Clostridia bacterium]